MSPEATTGRASGPGPRRGGKIGAGPSGLTAGRQRLLAGAAVAGLTVAAFLTVRGNGFISLDDPAYLTANAQVQRGLTLQGAVWAFTTFQAACWHPLTWLSHMADVELFGLDPGPHHLHSLALHGLAAVLLFVALDRMTGRLWVSALAAAVFAVHPLRVESVAWAAERKDVLAACWWMLAMLLYARHAARPSPGRMAGVAAALAAGLLAKPMLVSLPFALLLLDAWPLRRVSAWTPAGLWPLVREKWPLLVLVTASAVVTLAAEHAGAAVVDWQSLPLAQRLANAVVAYARYLLHFVWPTRLAVLYPLAPDGLPWTAVMGAAALVAGLTAASVGLRQRAPWLLVGWLWFVGTLVPVIGIVQIGAHALADRFSYVPSVGLGVAVAWGALALVERWPRSRTAVATAAVAVVVGLAAATHAQCQRWRSSESLYRHTLAVTPGNWVILTNMGIELARDGKLAAALENLEAAIRVKPDFAMAHNNRGNVLAAMGRNDEALAAYRQAVSLDEGNAKAQYNLGVALMGQQQWEPAIAHLRRAVELDPAHAGAHNNLGVALAATGQPEAAAEQFRQALRLRPDDQQARANLRRLGSTPATPADR